MTHYHVSRVATYPNTPGRIIRHDESHGPAGHTHEGLIDRGYARSVWAALTNRHAHLIEIGRTDLIDASAGPLDPRGDSR